MTSPIAQAVHSKAQSAGLSTVTVLESQQYYYRRGRNRISTGYQVSFRGTAEQEEAFKGSLEGTEAEDLDFIRISLGQGEVCPAFTLVATADGIERVFPWSTEDPKVYLIDFWATWCRPCQGPMAHNQEMLERNPDWEGQVEIVTISMDEDKETVEQLIKAVGWTKVSSYWAGDFRAPVPTLFTIEGIPTCLLVKQGKILWRGHPSERKLEEDIQHLLTHDSLPVEITPPSFVLAEEEKQASLDKAKLLLSTLDGLRICSAPFFFYIEKVTLTSEGVTRLSEFTLCGGFLGKCRPEVDAVFQTLKETFPNATSRCSFYKVLPPIHKGERCNVCAHIFSPADTQYLCVHCEPAHYHCQACEDLPREGHGSAKLAHPHSLYVLYPEANHLDELIIGSNLPKDPDLNEDPEERRHGECGCDNGSACGGAVVGVRYHCAQCPTFDLCAECEAAFRGSMPEDQKARITAAGHLFSHVLVKIPFPLKDYGYASNEE